jgi:hypothetical protein
MKKRLTSILALAIVAVMLAACGSGGSDNGGGGGGNTPAPTPASGNNDGPGTPVTTPEPHTVELDVWGRPTTTEDGLPLTAGFTEVKMDLDGRHIIIMDHISSWYNYNATDPDRTSNETLEVIRIMREIGDDYNATIEVRQGYSGNSMPTNMLAHRSTGDTPYDMYAIGTTDANLVSLYTAGVFMNMRDPRIADVIAFDDNPWDAESGLGLVNGVQVAVHFKPMNSMHLLRSTTVFNRTFMERWNFPNLYEMAFNFTWTFDAFESLAARVIAESNGEVFPLYYNRESGIFPSIVFANGGRIVDATLDGTVFVAHEDEKTMEALNWLYGMREQGFIQRRTDPHPTTMLANGIMMFSFSELGALRNLTRQDPASEFNFGLLPTPMGPSATDYTSVSIAAHMYHIVSDIRHPEEVAAILVAMANRLTRLDIVDHELKFGLQDDTSARVMELILHNVVVDHSRIPGDPRTTIRQAFERIESLSQTPSQSMQQIAEQIQRQYDAVRMGE